MLSNVVASQIDLHAKFGGVFPEVASRQHIRTIYAVVEQALQQAHMRWRTWTQSQLPVALGWPGRLWWG
jgi:N6-L-threonylcarbamoyladenine synthase